MVDDETCRSLGREVHEAKFCYLPNENFTGFNLKNAHKCSNAIKEEQSIIFDGTKNQSCEILKHITRLEILNLNSAAELQRINSLKTLQRIETCLIIRNSSAFTNLHIFKSLQNICKGCEWNGSIYKVILENNENLETLWHSTSKLNTAEGKIYKSGNRKLKEPKDKNGIFKCNFPEISVEIIAKSNSALMITDLDMTMNLTYSLTCEDCNTSFE
jgi:hypothetical protein